jgi:3-oxoadipate enol-lactonase
MPLFHLSSRLHIHFEEVNPQGSPTVLLLHGLGATGESWSLQSPALSAAGYRLLIPDIRSFGQSGYPGGRIRISDLAQDMVELLRFTSIDQTHVVGISMGGTIALQLALDFPELVDKLVLVNTFSHLRPEKPGVWAYFLLRFLLVHTTGLATQAKAVAKRVFPRPDQEELRRILYNQIMQAHPDGYRATMRALALFDVRHRLAEISALVLVITGSLDTTVPPVSQFEMASKISTARQVVISGAGHAVSVDCPEEFNRALIEFLNHNGIQNTHHSTLR